MPMNRRSFDENIAIREVPRPLSGTFAARGAGVAIDVQVTSVADGTVIWAEHYDYPDGNDPNINVDVALRATSGLRLRHADCIEPGSARPATGSTPRI